MKKLHLAALAVLCGFAYSEVCATLSDRLILHYAFDEAFSGSTQNHGTGAIIGRLSELPRHQQGTSTRHMNSTGSMITS
jgi:hypothetical protein